MQTIPVNRRTLTLSLALTPGIGAKILGRILSRNDLLSRAPEDFLIMNEEVLKEEYKIPNKTSQNWVNNRQQLLRQAQELEERLDQYNVHCITSADAHYPKRIEEMFPNPPTILYAHGNIDLLDRQLFSIMSSRNSKPIALNMIESLTHEGIKNGEVLLSGHSTPEYQRAAVVPLRWGTPRMLVLDRGLFKAMGDELSQEPFGAARLWRYQFDPNTDLALSCVNPNKDFYPSCNVVRDELIGTLANRIDFVEISPKGNMHKIACAALNIGKKVRVSTFANHYEEYKSMGATILEPTTPI